MIIDNGRVMRRLLLVVCVALLAAAAVSGPAQARVYIDITQPFSRRLPIAIPEFQPLAGATPDSVGPMATRMLQKNLEFTGLFDFLDPKSFLGKANPEQVEYKRAGR
ncbi:hypothetical protein [Desulfarculus baarsii]|uniref:hypothetical protein n=1 Tax=Desulfarculus baarsii TaxID=453230 RepID=UPI0002EC61DC|nr:hypothetical protein [Desulfarculus baarsii]